MHTNSLFIIGDEFLRQYNPNDKSDRISALKDYHMHIIGKARNEGHSILARLEELALESGINETGDFKVSCQEYESYLDRSGFSVDIRRKIGPSDNEINGVDIGGVYVYQCHLK